MIVAMAMTHIQVDGFSSTAVCLSVEFITYTNVKPWTYKPRPLATSLCLWFSNVEVHLTATSEMAVSAHRSSKAQQKMRTRII